MSIRKSSHSWFVVRTSSVRNHWSMLTLNFWVIKILGQKTVYLDLVRSGTEELLQVEDMDNVWLEKIWLVWPSNIIICAAPKCGSTTYREGMLHYLQKRVRNPHKASDFRLKSKKELQKNIHKEFVRVVLVRNPVSRMFSAFMDKCFRPPKFAKAFCKLSLLDGNLSFRIFVQNLYSQRKRRHKWNSHIRPVTDLCGLRIMPWDLLVRQERLFADSLAIFNLLPDSFKPGFSTNVLPHLLNRSNHYSASEIYSFDKATLQKIIAIYFDDFAAFAQRGVYYDPYAFWFLWNCPFKT